MNHVEGGGLGFRVVGKHSSVKDPGLPGKRKYFSIAGI